MNNAINYVVVGGYKVENSYQSSDMIVYEYPLNDSTRICLRLENLFKNITENVDAPSQAAGRSALSSLLEILNVVDRPDLKSKLTQTLTQYNSALKSLQNNPQIEQVALQEIINEISVAMQTLRVMHGRVGDNLRSNQFLNTIRMHLNHPGGACDYSTPAFALWLKQDIFSRKQQITNWFTEFAELKSIIELILRLTRQSATWETHHADRGFYQQKLDLQSSHQMLRLELPTNMQLIPEFSVGKHRFSVRLLNPNYSTSGNSTQHKENIDLKLMICRI